MCYRSQRLFPLPLPLCTTCTLDSSSSMVTTSRSEGSAAFRPPVICFVHALKAPDGPLKADSQLALMFSVLNAIQMRIADTKLDTGTAKRLAGQLLIKVERPRVWM
jgi:hypothetical protein